MIRRLTSYKCALLASQARSALPHQEPLVGVVLFVLLVASMVLRLPVGKMKRTLWTDVPDEGFDSDTVDASATLVQA